MPATNKYVRIIRIYYRSRFQFRCFQSIVAPSHERIVSDGRSPLASEAIAYLNGEPSGFLGCADMHLGSVTYSRTIRASSLFNFVSIHL